jgi:hypothetical protein
MLDEEIATVEIINNNPPDTDVTQKVYTMGPGRRMPIGTRIGNDSVLYFLNGHGDVSATMHINETTEYFQNEYEPFGEYLLSEGEATFAFSAKIFDEEVGYASNTDGSIYPFTDLIYAAGTRSYMQRKQLVGMNYHSETGKSSSIGQDWFAFVIANCFWDEVNQTYNNCFFDFDAWFDPVGGDGGGGTSDDPHVCWKEKTKGDCYNCCAAMFSEGVNECHWVTLATLFTVDSFCVNMAWIKSNQCTKRCDEEY